MMFPRRVWILRALLLEKVAQHAFVTWVFTTGRFGLRNEVAVDYRWLAVAGGLLAILFATALAGHLAGRRWSAWFAAALVAVDIVGEFVAQGTVSITVTVSFVVAIVVLVLVVRELRPT
jgi:hypothetical protein